MESEKVITAEDVLVSLMNDGTMDAMRLKVIRQLKAMEDLKNTTANMVQHSKVLNTPGADKQSKRQLFDALRHELEAPALERASKLVWELILDNDELGKEINQTVEKVFCRLSGREPPLFPPSISELRQDKLKEKESSENEKESEQIEEGEHAQRSSDPPSTPIDSVPDPRNVTDGRGKSFEAEPRRCGRTDGKSWRCSKSCVLDSKYCERHKPKSKKLKKPAEINNQGNVVDESPYILGSTSSQFVISKTNNNHRSSRSKRKASPRRGSSPKTKKECL